MVIGIHHYSPVLVPFGNGRHVNEMAIYLLEQQR